MHADQARLSAASPPNHENIGMNFTHFPLLDETYGFLLFWIFTAVAVAFILWFFWLKGWWTM